MLFFSELLEDAQNLGGAAARTAVSVAVPVPGAGIILSPVASLYGEAIGELIPTNNVPRVMRDSVSIYKTGGSDNTSFSPKDQMDVRTRYVKKAKSLGYNKFGQAIAAVDPGLLTIAPNVITKRKTFF